MPGFRCCQCFDRKLVAEAAAQAEVDEQPQQFGPQTQQRRSRLGVKVREALERFGNQRPSGGFLNEAGAIDAASVKVTKATILPVEAVQPGKLWSIKGIYHHQARNIGFRHMDQVLPENGLLDRPTGSKGALLKWTMISDLLQGKRSLQTFPAAEISAAQPDLPRLTFRQLLRLQVLLQDVSFSGSNHSGSAFLQRLESLVYESFARQLFDEHGKKLQASVSLGREATSMSAASSGLQAPTVWWAWWLPVDGSEQRWYFNAKTFTISQSFPNEGALEISDYSKPDLASGGLIWMDWMIKYHKSESSLAASPPARSKKSGIAGVVSEDVLQGAREKLQSFK